MVKTIKCGDYMIKDGIPFYRPGKRFVVVDMPKRMWIPYPEEKLRTAVECEYIEQINELSNQEWKRKQIKRRQQMARMFAKKVLVREFKKPVVCVHRAFCGLKGKIKLAVALHTRSRND